MTETSSAPAHAAEALRAALTDPRAAWPGVELREHQLEALDELAGRLAGGAQRTWVHAPTGSGKTITFCALAAALGVPTLVLVPRRNLADQTAAGLVRHFPGVPYNMDGPSAAGRPGITISTYQAALRHAQEMEWESVGLVICDEAHTTLGAQTRRLLDRAEQAALVGFTATPSTTTGHVEQVFGPVAATLDRLVAIERGILAPLRSLRVERDIDLSDVTKVRGDFDQVSLGRALDRALWHRACADVWVQHFAPLELAGVAYTATVAQAQALADEMRERGVKARAVSGQTQPKELRQILNAFGNGHVDVLCNADLLTEGWDETRASVVMHLAPTTSERVFVQRLGRVMRPAEGKEAVSVEFLPAGDPMGVQTSHDLYGLGWYRPLARVAGPPDSAESGKLAAAARLLAEQEGNVAKLVNPQASPANIAAGLADGGWRAADPGLLPRGAMEDWVAAAAREITLPELTERLTAGVGVEAALAWWALTGVVARKAGDGADQPLWRAWAMALLVEPELRSGLPLDAPRSVLDRLRMTARERLRALWWHSNSAGKWDRLAALEQLSRSGDRRRRWSAVDEAGPWAPAWAWDVSRALADGNRPGRNQELHRIAAWEARHIIAAGGELGLIATWLRAAGAPPPTPVPPEGETPPLRLGQAARIILMLGPGDVPSRGEYLRLTARAAAACGGWAELRGFLDSIDWSTPDASRSLRAAVGAMAQKALSGRRAWAALRAKAPRLPEPEVVGVVDPGEEGEGGASRRRRRRRRLRTSAATEGQAAPATANGGGNNGAGPEAGADGAEATGGQRKRRRRRRRRRPAENGGGAQAAPNGGPPQPSDAPAPPARHDSPY
ncbi:MAG TPA: DEAD/DEAH box helicase [Miltoncostaeaceae bacterium]|nr:DEAD/DEAH box helicase [Miltoncostaeaceae bacterium]